MSESDKETVLPMGSMEAFVAQAMAERLFAEAKTKLITDAVAGLLIRKTVGSGWDKREIPSVLESAFTDAVHRVATVSVMEYVMDDLSIKAKIGEMVAKVSAQVLESDEFVLFLAGQIRKAVESIR